MAMIFNGVEITEETINNTKDFFIGLYRSIIDDIELGNKTVNDPDSAIGFYLNAIRDQKNDKGLYSLAFMQRAYFIQTGESVALLP